MDKKKDRFLIFQRVGLLCFPQTQSAGAVLLKELAAGFRETCAFCLCYSYCKGSSSYYIITLGDKTWVVVFAPVDVLC